MQRDSMEYFVLKRLCKGRDMTDGVITDTNGNTICSTSERTQTMLPEGVYQLTISERNRFGVPVPMLTRVGRSKREEVRSALITPQNGVMGRNFGASIIAGKRLTTGVVINTKPYIKALCNMIKALKKAKVKRIEMRIEQ